MLLLSALFLLGAFAHVSSFTDHPFFPLLKEVNGASLKPAFHLHNKLHQSNADSTESSFAQNVDHFDGSSKTFKQRYYVNKAYASNTQIHILYLEGPEEADPTHITNGNYSHVQNAKALNATLWSLEHRYYGTSQPYSSVSTKNLNKLDTKQAVEDVATFIKAQNKASGEKAPKWILYGAFYGGSLALWTRQKYPDLTVGVVSSSAPAIPAADFYMYQKNVEDAYKNYSEDCYKNIYNGVKSIRQQMQSDTGRKNISTDFKLKPAFDKLKVTYADTQFFHIFLAFFFQQSVQFNNVNVGPFANKGGIADVCTIFTNQSFTDYQKVQNFVTYIVPVITGKTFSGLPNDYNLFVRNLRNSEISSDYLSTRSWLWQRCNEVGYFYTTDCGHNYAFGSTVPNNFWINVCTNVFGAPYGVNNLQRGVKQAIKTYGATGVTNVTNAVILQGSVDPWRSVGVSQASDSSSSIITVQNYGQAADLRPSAANDNYSLNLSRRLTLRRIRQWISPSKSSRTSGKKGQPSMKVFEDEAEKHIREAAELKIHNWHAKVEWNSQYPDADKPRAPKFRHENTFSDELERKYASTNATKSKKVSHGYILQDVDHFNSSNNVGRPQWRQHFFYNGEFEDTSAPIFLMMGGEAPISKYELVYTYMAAMAEDFGAAMYTCEHRFYGKSQPTNYDLSLDSLQFLTFEQALADAAIFVRNIKISSNRTDSTWIVFGGSYPGMLAAWFRLKYPDLVAGAIASSAPVNAQVDSFEYMQVVHNATQLWGSKTCRQDVHDLFAILHKMLNTVIGRKKLAKVFGVCQDWNTPSVDYRDIQQFTRMFINILAGTVQYDDPAHEGLAEACDELKQIGEYVNRVDKAKMKLATKLELHKTVKSFHSRLPSHIFKGKMRRCMDVSYTSMVEDLAEEVPYNPDGRSYQWQSCTQMGISESTDIGYNVFESALSPNYYTDLCLAFGPQFTRQMQAAGMRRTNAVYGGQDNYTASNVVWVNGSEDPWHPPSVYNPVAVNNTVILIEGTSHCADMYPPMKDDPDKITSAHKQIKEEIQKWLGIPQDSDDGQQGDYGN